MAYNPEPKREHLNVLIKLADGQTPTEIAAGLGVTVDTVYRKVDILIQKLGQLAMEQDVFKDHATVLRLRGQERYMAYADMAVDLRLLLHGPRSSYRIHPSTILTPTQREILLWLASGHTITETAVGSGLSDNAVKSAVIRIREILNTRNTVHSAVVAISLGIIHLSETAVSGGVEILDYELDTTV